MTTYKAMTGEITIRGDVLPIGAVEEKVLGAYEGGIKDMIVPLDNQWELTEFLNINKWLRERKKQFKKMEKSRVSVSARERVRQENFKYKRKLIKSIKKKKLMNIHYVEKLD